MSTMSVNKKEMPGQVALVEIEHEQGTIDDRDARDLERELNTYIDEGGLLLVVDLLKVPGLSSSALRVLVSTLKRVKDSGGDLVVVSDSDRVKEVFDLAGLASIIVRYDDAVAAMAAIGR